MRSFDHMNRMFREMDRMFDQMRTARRYDAAHGLESGPTMALEGEFDDESRSWPTDFGELRSRPTRSTRGLGDAAASLEEVDGSYVFVMDLPGFEKTDIDLAFDDGVLSIRARADHESDTDVARSMRSRRVSRRVPIPAEIAAEEIDASYRNGVLEVRLPVLEDGEDGHRIDID